MGVQSDISRHISSKNAKHSVELSDLRSQEGYDKPWDLRPDKRDERGQEGYDRPWDLKPHNKDERPTEEYDVPWDKNARKIERELKAAHKESMQRRDGSCKMTSSIIHGVFEPQQTSNSICHSSISKSVRLDDTRSSEEYDEPWDRKIKNIMSKVTQSRNQIDKLGAMVAAPRKTARSKKASARSATFDLTAPLESQSWYHGMISRTQAENILRSCQEGSYLVRTSESSHKDYSLSVKSTGGFMHMKITRQDSGFILGQFSQPFQTIPQMIHHYTVNKLPIKGAEHISLIHPISHECL